MPTLVTADGVLAQVPGLIGLRFSAHFMILRVFAEVFQVRKTPEALLALWSSSDRIVGTQVILSHVEVNGILIYLRCHAYNTL